MAVLWSRLEHYDRKFEKGQFKPDHLPPPLLESHGPETHSLILAIFTAYGLHAAIS